MRVEKRLSNVIKQVLRVKLLSAIIIIIISIHSAYRLRAAGTKRKE